MSVRQCQREIDAREFEEWLAYAGLEPWDQTRADLRAGIIASTLANIHRAPESPPFSPQDFMPAFGPQAAPELDEDAMILQMQQHMEWLTLAAGGIVQEGRP